MSVRGMVFGRVACFGLAALAAAGFSASASAQDIDLNPGEQLYAGPILGYDNVVLSDIGQSGNKGGLTYGGMVGVDTPVGKRARVGLEAQVAGSTTAATYLFSATSGGVTNTEEAKLSAGVDVYVGGKLGWMVAPRAQIFVTGGYANSKLAASLKYNGIKVAQYSTSLSGFRVGAGAEYSLSPHMRMRLEYRYTHYGEIDIESVATGVKAERHQVVGGLLYGF